MITKELIIQQLETIYDPEIPIDIYNLGLIYSVAVHENNVAIVMTLTTASCPAALLLPEEIKMVLSGIEEIGTIDVQVAFEPRWSRERISETGKKALGF